MALVVRFNPEIDPWEEQGEIQKRENKNIYPYPSQHRWGKYYTYYGENEEFKTTGARRKKKVATEYLRMENKKELDRYLQEHGISIELRSKLFTNLERYKTKNENYDFYVTLKNRKVDLKVLLRRVEWYKYHKEALEIYNSFDIEKKYIWHWISFYLGNRAKNSGLMMFTKDYILYKKGLQPYKEYPQSFENVSPEPLTFESIWSLSQYSRNILFYCYGRMYNPGIIFRAKIEPHPRYNRLPKYVFNMLHCFEYEGEYTVFRGSMENVKRQTYTIKMYAVNSWGVRTMGQQMTLPFEHQIIWNWTDQNHYWDEDIDEFVECGPPGPYSYSGSW